METTIQTNYSQGDMDFVVVDTEGKPEISELAIINSQGLVIYEGLSQDHPNHTRNQPNLKTLKKKANRILKPTINLLLDNLKPLQNKSFMIFVCII